jgi:hypothetical protein
MNNSIQRRMSRWGAIALLCLGARAGAEVVRYDNIEFEATASGNARVEVKAGKPEVFATHGQPGDSSWGNCVITLEPGIAWDRVEKIRIGLAGEAQFDVRVRLASDATRGYVPSLVFERGSVNRGGKVVEIPVEPLKVSAGAGDPPDAIVIGVGTDLGNTAHKSRLKIEKVEIIGGNLAPPAHEAARTCADWLDAMQDPVSGLVRSYDSQWHSFAYDQGAWAIAECALGKRERVEKLFRALAALQESNGMIRAGYHWKNSKVVFDQPSPGQMAWIGMAINAYTLKTGNREFLPMADKLAGYLLSQQASDGGIVGVDGNIPWDRNGTFNEYILWKSTEETMDVFSFLHHLGRITGEKKYTQAAQKARRFVESMWDEGHGMFCQGVQKQKNEDVFKRDLRFPGDVQYWTIMAVGPKGMDGQNYNKSLDLVEKKLAMKDGELTGISYSEEYAKKYPGCIWWDQTFSLAAAFDSIGDRRRFQKYFEAGAKAAQPTGAFGLTTRGEVAVPEWPVMPHASVAATSWYIFAREHVNPFHPSDK